MVKTVIEIRSGHLVGKAASDLFMAKAAPALLKVSKCKDFVVNRGHYFGTQYSQENKKLGKKGMSDTEKAALIEFLKYM